MANDTPNPTVPVSTLAKLFNLTDMRVQQLAKLGVVMKAAHGRYDLWSSIKGYIGYLQERKVGTGQTDNGEDPTLQSEKLRKLKADADMAEMDRDKQAGILQDEAAVVRVYAGRIVAVRAKMLGIPKKMSPQLVSMDDPAEIETMLKAEIYAALRDLGTPAQSDTNGTQGESTSAPAGAVVGSDGESGAPVPGAGGPAVDATAGVDGQPVG